MPYAFIHRNRAETGDADLTMYLLPAGIIGMQGDPVGQTNVAKSFGSVT